MTGAAAGKQFEAHELIITLVFNAPRALVFKAWKDPKHVARWWGAKGFTNPVCEMDVRQGGALRIVMRAPDGTDYPMRGIYREIVEPERLVFTNVALDSDGKPILDGLTTVTSSRRMARPNSPCRHAPPVWPHMRPACLKAWKRAGRKAWNGLRNI